MSSWIKDHLERYEPEDGDTKVAQQLFDKGLIWAINHAILHSRGYAIGVTTNPDDPTKVIDIFLVHGPDDEIIFDLEAGQEGYAKYLRALVEDGRVEYIEGTSKSDNEPPS